jgi:hypothetical protein
MWGSRDTINLIKEFNYNCPLTEKSSRENDIGIDHFIPISVGHGGTIKENLIPLERGVNISKGSKNPFEWINTRPDLSIENFNEIVSYLAELNKLTIGEYRQFVYWCYDNPRGLKEVEKDRRQSIDIWKEAIS